MAGVFQNLRHCNRMFTIGPTYRAFRVLIPSAFFVLAAHSSSAAANLPDKPAELFRLTNIWSVHLTFDPAEYKAMEPKGGGGFPGFGGPGGPGRGGPPFMRGPGGPGGPG